MEQINDCRPPFDGIPDATPLPGEAGLDVVQVLHMRGLLQTDQGAEQTDLVAPSSLNVHLKAALKLPGVQRICVGVRPFWQPDDRIRYIEAFLTAFKASSSDADVQQLLRVFAVTPQLSTPDDVGPGYAAVYFYMQERQATLIQAL